MQGTKSHTAPPSASNGYVSRAFKSPIARFRAKRPKTLLSIIVIPILVAVGIFIYAHRSRSLSLPGDGRALNGETRVNGTPAASNAKPQDTIQDASLSSSGQ